MQICLWRSCSNGVIGRRDKKFCSRKCSIKDNTAKNRIRFKRLAVEMLGGKCSRCGYSKSLRALQFHHLDPSQKSFGLSNGNTRSWKRHEEEIRKCVLLCANCHAEEEEFLLISSKIGIASHC